MDLQIVTPEKVVYEGEVAEIYIKTADGPLGIFPHHINLFSKIVPGELKLKVGGHDEFMALTGGFMEIQNNKVTILADYAVPAEEIQVERALEAKKRAEELLKRKETQMDEREFATAQAELAKALIELQVANRKRKRSVQ
ncbi:MAG TPA: ATP synthase F1 subunit epsilon [Candidatus Saccharimonadales bacterium]|nr:ATP synthase F1 subunit epsilon [Candidatus Saccharimonadales bacterium]